MADSDVTGPLESLALMVAGLSAQVATEKSLKPELGGGFDVAVEAAAASARAGALVGLNAHSFAAAMLAAMDARYAGATGWLTAEVASSPIVAADLVTPVDLIVVTMSGACAIEIPTAWLQAGKAVRVAAPSTASAETPVVLSTQGAEKISGSDTWTLNGASETVLLAPNAAKTAWFAVLLHKAA